MIKNMKEERDRQKERDKETKQINRRQYRNIDFKDRLKKKD